MRECSTSKENAAPVPSTNFTGCKLGLSDEKRRTRSIERRPCRVASPRMGRILQYSSRSEVPIKSEGMDVNDDDDECDVFVGVANAGPPDVEEEVCCCCF